MSTTAPVPSDPAPTPTPTPPLVPPMPIPVRANVTAVDADGGALTPIPTGGAVTMRLNCWTNTPGATCTIQVYFLDQQGHGQGTTTIAFAAPRTPDWGGGCVGVPAQDAWLPVCGAAAFVLRLAAMGGPAGAGWTIGGSLG